MHVLRISGLLIASQAVRPRVACVAYDSLESACIAMKMDLNVDFQAAICNVHRSCDAD